MGDAFLGEVSLARSCIRLVTERVYRHTVNTTHIGRVKVKKDLASVLVAEGVEIPAGSE